MSGSTTDPGMGSTAGQSSSEIERQVESTRAQLTGTLEELRDRASPGQLFEQALDYARESGGADFARNMGQQVRDNPLPLLLIGAGIGWLMLGNNQPSTVRPTGISGAGHQRALPPPDYLGQDRPSRGVTRVYGTEAGGTDAGGSSLGDRAAGAASEAKDRIGEAAEGLRDSLSGAAGRAGDMGDSAYQAVSGAVSSAAEGLGSVAQRARMASHDARDGVGDLADSTRQGVVWLMREQPLVLGAIGLALGAAVGAMLPGTEAEDRLMGETRDDLVERSSATAQQGYERVKEAAGEHLAQAKDRLGEGAPDANRVGEAVGGAAKGARETVTDLVRNVAGEAKSALNAGDDAKQGSAAPAGGPAGQPRRPDSPGMGTSPTPNPSRTGPL